MADHQKIHPLTTDVEAPPRTQPQASFGLEKGDPSSGSTIAVIPPPLAPNPNPNPDPDPKPNRCCCKCLCWTVGLLTLLLFIVGATAGIIYLVFQPKLPKYSVDNLRVSDLTLNFDLSLSLPRIHPQILPRASEQDGLGRRPNRAESVWECSTGSIAGAATDWKGPARS